MKYIAENNMLVTGSWDKTLKYWDTRSPGAILTVPLPERCYALDVIFPVLAVATAEKYLLVYDLRKPQQPVTDPGYQSPLKFQTTCLSLFPDQKGYAVGSIEGRVSIQHINKSDASKNFAFKCHRFDHKKNNLVTHTDVYSVNAIVFHKQCGTFATAGSDGILFAFFFLFFFV